MKDERPRRTGPGGRIPAAAAARAQPASPLLLLQRAAGNRAATQMLQRRPNRFANVALGANRDKRETRIKREIGTLGGYDDRLQAIAAARLAGADPAAVGLDDQGKWHAFELTEDYHGATYKPPAKAVLKAVYGLPSAKRISAQEAKIADLEKHKGDVAELLAEAARDLDALKLGLESAEVLRNRSQNDRRAGYVNVTASLANDPRAPLGSHGPEKQMDEGFNPKKDTAIELNPKALASVDLGASVLFHEAVHLRDYEFARKVANDAGADISTREDRQYFADNTVKKRANLTAAQKQLVGDIALGAFGSTEARAYIKTFIAAFDVGARARAAASLLAYANGMATRRVPAPTAGVANPVIKELIAELRAFRNRLDKPGRAAFDAAFDAAAGANKASWLNDFKLGG